jgi:hypothetical protein
MNELSQASSCNSPSRANIYSAVPRATKKTHICNPSTHLCSYARNQKLPSNVKTPEIVKTATLPISNAGTEPGAADLLVLVDAAVALVEEVPPVAVALPVAETDLPGWPDANKVAEIAPDTPLALGIFNAEASTSMMLLRADSKFVCARAIRLFFKS